MRNIILIVYLTILISQVQCIGSIRPKAIQGCFKVHGMPGNEDIALSRAKKLLYISSHNRRNFDEPGKIFSLDLGKPDGELKPKALNATYPPHFRPHGISLVQESGKELLYVISHTKQEGAQHAIEVFEMNNEIFSHIKTLKSPLIESPNDLFALPDGRIFVSNDGLSPSKISFFDGKTWSMIGPGVSLGNGILYRKEKDKEYIYRSGFFAGKVLKFELIQTTDGKTDLKEVEKFEIGSGPDNLEFDDAGNIYLAAHASVFRFLRHVRSPENFSPSQIFKIDFGKKSVDEIYANNGEEISAASTGLVFENRLIISQVFEDFLLICPTTGN
ncbi:MAG: arylesterase [Leptospira sp.]|nr:arylesterase [Leptospira sp.]